MNLYLLSFRIDNTNYNFYLGFRPITGRTWPRDPFKQVGLGKWYTNHPKLAPETDFNAVSWPFSGPDP